MFGVPATLWGHHILPYLHVKDFLALHCTSRHSRFSLVPCLRVYTLWLQSESQMLVSHPDLSAFHREIAVCHQIAKDSVKWMRWADLNEVMAIIRPAPRMLAVAKCIVLLLKGPQQSYWQAFVRDTLEIMHWLHSFDPFAPSILEFLPELEMLLKEYSAGEIEAFWKAGASLYHVIEQIVVIGHLRSEKKLEDMHWRLEHAEREVKMLARLHWLNSA